MTIAPVLANCSSSTSASRRSPALARGASPFMSGWSACWPLKIHLWSASPPSPNGWLFVPLGPVSDGTLKTLYAKSKAFVFPSRMEGFGLPALEAMESGSIVLASDCAALKEVCGDAARYFHPDDETRLAELIDWVMNLPVTERLTAMQLGKRRASSFSWEQVAKKTTQVYQTVIANHSGTA